MDETLPNPIIRFTVKTCPQCGHGLFADMLDQDWSCMEHGVIDAHDAIEVEAAETTRLKAFEEELESLAAANDLETRLLATNRKMLNHLQRTQQFLIDLMREVDELPVDARETAHRLLHELSEDL